MPPKLTAATGMDAVAHCVETFLSKAVNPPADAIALDGLEKAWRYVERATKDGQDREARYNMAVAAMESGWTEGRRHAVECDLKSFFDTVNHDLLMNALKEKIRCPRVLGLIRRYLMAGVELPDGTREATPQGVPQGGPLSPLLANIVLDPLDKELESRGHKFARYADDFLVMVKSAKAAIGIKSPTAMARAIGAAICVGSALRRPTPPLMPIASRR